MATLRQYLAATPRRMLLAIAQARGVRIPWEAPKTDLVTVLADKLLDSAQLGQVLESFSEAEHRVLNDLVAAGGRIPRRYLAHRYGDVRPYRPWQLDAPRRPWENPVSPVERLWFLGLIFLEPSTDDLVVPDDLMPHLPSPEQRPPQPVPGQGGLEPALLAAHDLACLLGLLQRDDVRPLHGRWLPPRTLAAWGEMCAWPPAAPDARSELHTGRRRFLHYLAEAGGLVGLAGPYLTPTPAAWLWLDAAPADRLNYLWQAWVTPDPACWRAYRLPGYELTPHPGKLVAAVVQALAELDPADPRAFAQALLSRQPALRDLLPSNVLDADEELAATIVALLTGPLVWLGVGRMEDWKDGRMEDWKDDERPPSFHPSNLPTFQPSKPVLNLTAWGAAWLGLAPAPEVPPPPRFGVTSEAASDPAAGEPGALIFTLRHGLPDPADLMLVMEVGIRESGIRDQGIRTQGISPPRRSGRGDQEVGSIGRGHSSPDFLSPDSLSPDSLSPDFLSPDSLSPDSLSPDSPIPESYRITAASFARALHRGWSAPALLDALEHSAERPLTGQERAMLRAWAEAAGRMAVRRLTLLEVTDPAIISRLAATRRGRDLIVRTLSPRAVVVDEARLDQLVRRLTQQEGAPPRIAIARRDSDSDSGYRSSLSLSGAAHAWLALKVYQGLGETIRLPARTPQTLLEYLAALADEDDLAAAETAAEGVLNALRQAMIGRVPFPPYPEDGLPLAESLALIRQALAAGQALEMDYYSAGRDVITHRVVEPYRLEERHGVHYLVGFCHRAQAERVFRLDRISSIVKVP